MAIPQRKGQLYTYTDYLNWPDDEKWEIIHGEPYAMSPAPSTDHQAILGELFYQFRGYLKNRTCQVFVAPFDVRMPLEDEKDEDTKSVVQPDISIICDKNKIDSKGCKGAPDLIVEIVSPSTFRKDVKDKFFLYERSGVKEYWLVYPNEKTLMVYKLGENGKYGRPEVYSEEDNVKVGIFQELNIELKDIFISS
jgi:Uma2 family endonuclease